MIVCVSQYTGQVVRRPNVQHNIGTKTTSVSYLHFHVIAFISLEPMATYTNQGPWRKKVYRSRGFSTHSILLL